MTTWHGTSLSMSPYVVRWWGLSLHNTNVWPSFLPGTAKVSVINCRPAITCHYWALCSTWHDCFSLTCFTVVSHVEKSIVALFYTVSWQMWTIRQASPRVLIDYSKSRNQLPLMHYLCMHTCRLVSTAHAWNPFPMPFHIGHILFDFHWWLSGLSVFAVDSPILFMETVFSLLNQIKRSWLLLALNCMTNQFHFNVCLFCTFAIFPLFPFIYLRCPVRAFKSITNTQTVLLFSKRIFFKWKSIFELTRHRFMPCTALTVCFWFQWCLSSCLREQKVEEIVVKLNFYIFYKPEMMKTGLAGSCFFSFTHQATIWIGNVFEHCILLVDTAVLILLNSEVCSRLVSLNQLEM